MAASLPQGAAVPVGRSSAAAAAWRFKGEVRVTVLVKAAFSFAEDGPMSRVEAPPVAWDDVHHGNNPMRSIVLASDLVPYKKQADVLFTGHAHAPPGATVGSLSVRLALLDGARTLLDKALLVRRDPPFQKVRLLWEHAACGPGRDDNPFGEEPDDDDPPEDLNVFDPNDARRPAGFAPIPRNMAPRKALLALLPAASFGRGLVPIPDSLPFELFQVAPADQRTDLLRGDEQIVLEGLHPRRPRVRARLPGARGVARIFGLSGAGIQDGTPLAMYADTLHVSGDDEQCVVTWRGTFAVPEAALDAVLVATGVESPGEAVVWPDRAALDRAAASIAAPSSRDRAPSSSSSTLPLSDDDIEVVSSSSSATLPVSPAALAAAVTPFAPSAAPAPLVGAARPPAVRTARSAHTETLPVTSSVARASQGAPLPFRPAAPGASTAGPSVSTPSTPSATRPRSSAGATLPLSSTRIPSNRPVLPFGARGAEDPVPAAPPPAVTATSPAVAPPPAVTATSPSAPAIVSPPSAPSTSTSSADVPPSPPVEAPATTGVEAPAATRAPAATGAPAAPPQAPSPPPREAPKAAAPQREKASDPWAPPPEAPRATSGNRSHAAPAPKKLPPKVDVKSKLYGPGKKGR